MQRFTDAQSGLQHQDGDIVQRLRTSGKIDLLLLSGEYKVAHPFTREQPDTWHPLKLFPFLGQPEHPTKRC